MTTEELCTEIERLNAAATAGPWQASGPGADSWVFTADGRRFDIGDRLYHPENDANAELIASYRTLAVEAAKKLRVLTAACEQAIEWIREDDGDSATYDVLSDAISENPLGLAKTRRLSPEGRRQVAASIEFFENGGEGKTLADLGL